MRYRFIHRKESLSHNRGRYVSKGVCLRARTVRTQRAVKRNADAPRFREVFLKWTLWRVDAFLGVDRRRRRFVASANPTLLRAKRSRGERRDSTTGRLGEGKCFASLKKIAVFLRNSLAHVRCNRANRGFILIAPARRLAGIRY